MKLTPVLLVESVENSLVFWVDRMGWQKTVEVPHGGQIGFAILENENSEIMLQTFESASQDVPQFGGSPGRCRTSLFIEVTDWNDTVQKLDGYAIQMPERTTFYGMREIGVFDPDGHIVIFAAKA